MNCKEVRSHIPGFLRGNTGQPEAVAVERHLAECAACREEFERISAIWEKLGTIPEEEPRPEMAERFHVMLDDFRRSGLPALSPEPADRERRIFSRVFSHPLIPRLAAAVVLLVAGFSVGRMSGPAPEIAVLHEEMTELKSLVTASIINQNSAIERLEGLTMARQVIDPDEQFLSVLVLTLNTDPNVNVRLAAVEALANFQQNRWVRTELAESLAEQTSPLVQISLIDLLVDMREEQALGIFRALADDDQSLEAVRKRARWGIQQMI